MAKKLKNKMVKCKHRGRRDDESTVWDESAPFVANPSARLIHRAKAVVTYNGSVSPGRLIIDYYCGGVHFRGHDDDLHFDMPDERILCARCESMATSQGEPAARDIVGRHVHIGGVVVVQHCCKGNRSNG